MVHVKKCPNKEGRGKPTTEWYMANGKPMIYCYGWIDSMTGEPLEICKPNGKGLNQKDIVAYIQDHLKIGDRFKAPHDLYNVDRVYLDDMTNRIVVDFYDHYILSMDDFGKLETFQYFGMYVLLRGQRK